VRETSHKIKKGTLNIPVLSEAICDMEPPKSLDELGGLLLY